jgi:predicted AAA+ superfamily ATPase
MASPAPLRYQQPMTDPLIRIADALETLAARPLPRPEADAATGDWFVWHDRDLAAVPPPRLTPLGLYAGVDAQKTQLHENLRRHAAGLPAHDVLLWGARGMGKSSLVRAAHGALLADGNDIALVQLAAPDLADLSRLFERLAPVRRRFTIFLDDLTLDGDGGHVHALRSLLDGGVMARPDHVRLVVTSNRRNLVPRSHGVADHDAVNPRDVADDQLALADRFGLRLGFHACDQADYLTMCANYAGAHGLAFDPAAALAWAAGRGARSGRVAWQFTVETAGAAGVALA